MILTWKPYLILLNVFFKLVHILNALDIIFCEKEKYVIFVIWHWLYTYY